MIPGKLDEEQKSSAKKDVRDSLQSPVMLRASEKSIKVKKV